ncbi:MAG: ABC transporter ATP-binding protein [Eubacteriales bacterium]|nr:ABC transporter ATP-binding protein [Eubacteriales bacterium]
MLKISNLTKTYADGKVGVQNLNLSVEAGDICAFIGPNGSGKTTTIRCIVGTLDFEAGEILIDNHSIKNDPLACKRVIAYIPDNPDVYTNLTGNEYLSFVASVYRVSIADRDQAIARYADEWGMTESLGLPIKSYSHGMRQKLVLIAAFMRNPKLLVLDEPFVGLDPQASFTLKKLMQEFVKNGGAIFYSTHVLEVAEKLCNKVIMIKNGTVIKQGTMKEIKADKSLEEVFLNA